MKEASRAIQTAVWMWMTGFAVMIASTADSSQMRPEPRPPENERLKKCSQEPGNPNCQVAPEPRPPETSKKNQAPSNFDTDAARDKGKR
jgi:hypothetical protein